MDPAAPSMRADLVRTAAEQAADLAVSAGVRVVPVTLPTQAYEVADLLSSIWGGDPTPLPGNAIVALSRSGSYVVAIHDQRADGRMIGASVAWFCHPERRALHSHITGVLSTTRGRDVGTAAKLHQRAWALQQGLDTIRWTYDPLIARNAHFNRNKLGARPIGYLVNCYGAMPDALNAGDESDRLEVAWKLSDGWPPAVDEGGPILDGEMSAASATVRFVQIPGNIEALRRSDPAAALAWRHRLRDDLQALLDDGWAVTGFSRRRGYVLRPSARPEVG